MNIEQGIEYFTRQSKMLSSLCVAYGNKNNYKTIVSGLASEVKFENGKFVDDKRSITQNTVYDLASITKLFTLISVLMLIESKALKMTDIIAEIDNRFLNLKNVSVYDVLAYRANLQSAIRIDRCKTKDEAEDIVFGIYNLNKKSERLYSDMNALVLKFIIEKVSKLNYEDFLKKYIFLPLSMKSTSSDPKAFTNDIVNYAYEHFILNNKRSFNIEPDLGEAHDPKARTLMKLFGGLSGHAGLFSTIDDMARFAMALLNFKLISEKTTMRIGRATSGYIKQNGDYEQYMGLLCFVKSNVKKLSEVPHWMSDSAFGIGGYTGNHIAIDIENGVFDVMLGNRCHNRIGKLSPRDKYKEFIDEKGAGAIAFDAKRIINCSFEYMYSKDECIHYPIKDRLIELGWLKNGY